MGGAFLSSKIELPCDSQVVRSVEATSKVSTSWICIRALTRGQTAFEVQGFMVRFCTYWKSLLDPAEEVYTQNLRSVHMRNSRNVSKNQAAQNLEIVFHLYNYFSPREDGDLGRREGSAHTNLSIKYKSWVTWRLIITRSLIFTIKSGNCGHYFTSW